MCTVDFPRPHQISEHEEKWKMCKIIYDKFHFILKQMLYDICTSGHLRMSCTFYHSYIYFANVYLQRKILENSIFWIWGRLDSQSKWE